MNLIKLPPQGNFMVNSYFVVSKNKNAVLIDAPSGGQKIIELAEKNNIKIKKILLTHGHCDHIESLIYIAKKTDAKVYIHSQDAVKLIDPDKNLSILFNSYLNNCNVSGYDKAIHINDDSIITLDELSFKVLHTPGHSDGCVCYLIDNIIFSGDTLFNLSVGRTDLADGNISVLNESLKRLYELNGDYKDYRILPGHGIETTLSFEKKHNPYFNVRNNR